MRLADYIVSYSLQINNRCLRYLAECEAHRVLLDSPGNDASGADTEPLQAEMHTVYAESLLARDSRRLSSMWQLTVVDQQRTDVEPDDEPEERSAGVAPELMAHIRELHQHAAQLADVASARRLAVRLASVAQHDEDAQAMLLLARQLPGEHAPTWEVLNELFAADSRYWRQPQLFADLSADLLSKRIARSYRKAYRLAKDLHEQKSRTAKVAWLDKKHQKLFNWAQACAHQMELLRPGLSDSTKAQLWYMDKLADTLRMRIGLGDLLMLEPLQPQQRAHAAPRSQSGPDAGGADRARDYITEQIAKMDKRTLRLLRNCFVCKPKKFAVMMAQSVAELRLDNISLMAPGGAASPGTGPVTGGSTTGSMTGSMTGPVPPGPAQDPHGQN